MSSARAPSSSSPFLDQEALRGSRPRVLQNLTQQLLHRQRVYWPSLDDITGLEVPPPLPPSPPPSPRCGENMTKWFPIACDGLAGMESVSPPSQPSPPPPSTPRMVGDELRNATGKNPANAAPAEDSSRPPLPPVQTTDETLFQGVGFDSPCRACCACLSSGHG